MQQQLIHSGQKVVTTRLHFLENTLIDQEHLVARQPHIMGFVVEQVPLHDGFWMIRAFGSTVKTAYVCTEFELIN